MCQVHEELHSSGGDGAEAQARRILFGLGFDDVMQVCMHGVHGIYFGFMNVCRTGDGCAHMFMTPVGGRRVFFFFFVTTFVLCFFVIGEQKILEQHS